MPQIEPDPAPAADRLDETTVLPPNLARRMYAAGIDVAVVGLCCGALFLSFNPVLGRERPWLWRPAAIVLALVAAAEIFTGVTPGKLLTRLTLRTRDGKRVPIPSLVVRGVVRLLPVALFLPSLATSDTIAWMFIVQVLIVLVGCYLTVCYMTLWRRGDTMFDAVARTVVVPAT